MFQDREDAGYRLAQRLKGREFHDLLVLAIPRGGVVTGAVLARELEGELDVVLSRKLRAPGQPELAIGAVSEDGRLYLNDHAREVSGLTAEYLARERRDQLVEIAWRKKLFGRARPRAAVKGRSVIVTDDGIATGSTMIAALQVIAEQDPAKVIVAVPVASPTRLEEVRGWCDEVVCLLAPQEFRAVSQVYADFSPVEDEQVVALLRSFAPPARPRESAPVGR
jgi:predicted phosphoribosyltransferase